MLTIALPPGTESRLNEEALRRGLNAADYACELIESALIKKPEADLATLEWLDKWEAENQTSDPEEIARRQKEFEEFKEGMNRNRREMEGPDSRLVYP